jgi:hypothetical protein
MLGLLIEIVCLFWNRPIAFVVFMGIGGFFLGLGMLVYLFTLITKHSPHP